MSDTDFEFNMDFALMDQQIEKFKAENNRILNEWYKDCELLHTQLADLHNINKELEQDLAKAAEVLKHIEEQSRHNVSVVVGAPLREAVCSCLDNICEKVDLS
jgi:DNA anti-recombination protein RmuC